MSSHLPEPSLVERTGVLAGDPVLHRERDAALGALTTVRAPGLAPLVRAAPVGDAHALTHLVPSGCVELAGLRETVPLRPGHVVTVLGTVLDALDAVHRAHLAHGAVDAERVLVGPDGSVALGGCGLAWSVPPGCAGGPAAADDVADVAVLARHLLGAGSAPPALVIALLRAADPDPALRPDAASLAAMVRAAVPAEPLLDLLWVASPGARTIADGPVTGPADRTDRLAAVLATPRASAPAVPRPVPRSRRARTGRATAVLLALSAVALPLVAWAALRLPTQASADPGAAAPAPTRSAPTPTTDWKAVLQHLDDVRHRAVLAGSTALLDDAVDPSGSAWSADHALAARVAGTGARVSGGALVVSSVELVGAGAEQVLLRVRDVRAAYDVVAGGVTTHVAQRGTRTWEVTLVRSGAGWRIGDVGAAGPDPQ